MNATKAFFAGFMLLVVLNSCTSPTVALASSQTPATTRTGTATWTKAPMVPITATATETLTLEPTLTATSTPVPVVYCADKLPGCYFLGNEFAKYFALMTAPCFANGGKCYPPAEECSALPVNVPHVQIRNLADGWKSEVEASPSYKFKLDPVLYDPAKDYCFVDEGIAELVRDAGEESFEAKKACLDDKNVPCNVVLRIYKIDYDNFPRSPQLTAYLTNNNFLVAASWASSPVPAMELVKVLNGQNVRNPAVFEFAYVFVSSTVGFNNQNPPLGIFIAPFK